MASAPENENQPVPAVGGGPSRTLPPWLEQLRAYLANSGQDTEADEDIAEMIAAHESLDALCDDEDCFFCAWRACPHRCVLHYHHDGCPSCSAHTIMVHPQIQPTNGAGPD